MASDSSKAVEFLPLAGKRFIVTGAASGMGEATAHAYARAGADVAILDIAARGNEVAEVIAAETGCTVCFMQCDVAEEAVGDAIDQAVHLLGGLDGLVHAAGIASAAPADSMTLADWNRVMSVNATSTFLTNRAVFPHLKDKGGRILNFASSAGVLGYPGKAHYAAAKAAVLGWTRTIAQEWGQYGITANAIAPAIWTPMYEATRAAMSPERLVAHDADQRRKRHIGGKLGDPERDFAPMMVFLAGDGARFLTGQTYKIDGGALMLS